MIFIVLVSEFFSSFFRRTLGNSKQKYVTLVIYDYDLFFSYYSGMLRYVYM